jgi:hypothetical protein
VLTVKCCCTLGCTKLSTVTVKKDGDSKGFNPGLVLASLFPTLIPLRSVQHVFYHVISYMYVTPYKLFLLSVPSPVLPIWGQDYQTHSFGVGAVLVAGLLQAATLIGLW